MHAKQHQSEDEADDLLKLMNHRVGSFGEGVFLLLTAMVENAHKDAEHGDKSAQAFVKDWQAYFADRRHN